MASNTGSSGQSGGAAGTNWIIIYHATMSQFDKAGQRRLIDEFKKIPGCGLSKVKYDESDDIWEVHCLAGTEDKQLETLSKLAEKITKQRLEDISEGSKPLAAAPLNTRSRQDSEDVSETIEDVEAEIAALLAEADNYDATITPAEVETERTHEWEPQPKTDVKKITTEILQELGRRTNAQLQFDEIRRTFLISSDDEEMVASLKQRLDVIEDDVNRRPVIGHLLKAGPDTLFQLKWRTLQSLEDGSLPRMLRGIAAEGESTEAYLLANASVLWYERLDGTSIARKPKIITAVDNDVFANLWDGLGGRDNFSALRAVGDRAPAIVEDEPAHGAYGLNDGTEKVESWFKHVEDRLPIPARSLPVATASPSNTTPRAPASDSTNITTHPENPQPSKREKENIESTGQKSKTPAAVTPSLTPTPKPSNKPPKQLPAISALPSPSPAPRNQSPAPRVASPAPRTDHSGNATTPTAPWGAFTATPGRRPSPNNGVFQAQTRGGGGSQRGSWAPQSEGRNMAQVVQGKPLPMPRGHNMQGPRGNSFRGARNYANVGNTTASMFRGHQQGVRGQPAGRGQPRGQPAARGHSTNGRAGASVANRYALIDLLGPDDSPATAAMKPPPGYELDIDLGEVDKNPEDTDEEWVQIPTATMQSVQSPNGHHPVEDPHIRVSIQSRPEDEVVDRLESDDEDEYETRKVHRTMGQRKPTPDKAPDKGKGKQNAMKALRQEYQESLINQTALQNAAAAKAPKENIEPEQTEPSKEKKLKINKLIKTAKTALMQAKNFRGSLSLEMQIGKIFIPNLPADVTHDYFDSNELHTQLVEYKLFGKMDEAFTDRITTSTADISAILRIVGMERAEKTMRTAYWELICHQSNGEEVLLCLNALDNEQNADLPQSQNLVYAGGPKEVLGAVYFHSPRQFWDARFVVHGRRMHTGIDGVKEFGDSIFIRNPEGKGPELHAKEGILQIEKVRLVASQSFYQRGEEWLKVKVNRVLEFRIIRKVSNVPENAGIFRTVTESEGTMIKDQRLWYTVSLVPDLNSDELSKNQSLDYGTEVGWSEDDIIQERHLRQLEHLTNQLVEGMDNVGAGNEGPVAELHRKIIRARKRVQSEKEEMNAREKAGVENWGNDASW